MLDDDLLVVAEEFGQWEDARRRIDLLAVDKSGHLVVIELKRTDDGGHMELQALRYAAMVSSMLFDDVVRVFDGHLTQMGQQDDARQVLQHFLEVDRDENDAPVIASEVRIILVSANFGRELTTAVLWLNEFDGMDIRCVRLVPYRIDDRVFLDIQQIVPLREAADYQVRLRRKEQQRERARTDRRDFSRYHVIVGGMELDHQNKRQAIRIMVEQLIEHGAAPAEVAEVLGASKVRFVEGRLDQADELVAAIEQRSGPIDAPRWFLDYPIHHDGMTWVLSKDWGPGTERLLTELANRFIDTGVSFRRADA